MMDKDKKRAEGGGGRGLKGYRRDLEHHHCSVCRQRGGTVKVFL